MSLIGVGQNDDQYFTGEDMKYYMEKYGDKNLSNKNPTKIK